MTANPIEEKKSHWPSRTYFSMWNRRGGERDRERNKERKEKKRKSG